ncbi:hypothetical protein GW932_03530 [archaeon]|nr:hypothetical protein [archaeon]
MKDIWKNAQNNFERYVKNQINFGFVLYQTGLEEEFKEKTENEFREKISGLTEIVRPKEGDIITLEDNFLGNQILYAGIVHDERKLISMNQYEICPPLLTPSEIISYFGNKHSEMKFYKIHKKV